jgi:hypothetical protein
MIMQKVIIAGAAGLITIALVGCASTSSLHAGSSSGPATSSSTSTAPSSQGRPQQSGPGGVPVVQTVREGQPFNVSYQYSTGGTAT